MLSPALDRRQRRFVAAARSPFSALRRHAATVLAPAAGAAAAPAVIELLGDPDPAVVETGLIAAEGLQRTPALVGCLERLRDHGHPRVADRAGALLVRPRAAPEAPPRPPGASEPAAGDASRLEAGPRTGGARRRWVAGLIRTGLLLLVAAAGAVAGTGYLLENAHDRSRGAPAGEGGSEREGATVAELSFAGPRDEALQDVFREVVNGLSASEARAARHWARARKMWRRLEPGTATQAPVAWR
jgi:hypothetical protein